MKQLSRTNVLIIIGVALALCFPLVRYLDNPSPKKPKPIEEKVEAKKVTEPEKVDTPKVERTPLQELAFGLSDFLKTSRFTKDTWSYDSSWGEDGAVILGNLDRFGIRYSFNITDVVIKYTSPSVELTCKDCMQWEYKPVKNLATQVKASSDIDLCRGCDTQTSYALFKTLEQYKAAVEQTLPKKPAQLTQSDKPKQIKKPTKTTKPKVSTQPNKPSDSKRGNIFQRLYNKPKQ